MDDVLKAEPKTNMTFEKPEQDLVDCLLHAHIVKIAMFDNMIFNHILFTQNSKAQLFYFWF